ncbi:hypothetical protein HH682_00910 [Rosenbergiella sp. S61]|uniref:Uncharacterized protein n=1 Tax=Rosenbergiella gaditana TaxID=2726987 RepID=A0ABS5SSM7_9GAMM|nr:hypothetical protein [Rosenbergiella gaditana]MBT0723024.1 hypothetical protein [Rosenbergiella gaditana]
MRLPRRSLPLMLSGVLLLASSCYADSTQNIDQRLDQLMGAHSHTQYHQFFETFQRAVVSHNKQQVASMLSYPITAQVAGRDRILLNKKAFLAVYDKVFTPSLQDVVRHQRYSDLFANSDGVMIGEQGEIWFSGICQQGSCRPFTVKIIRINGDSR